MLKNTTHNLENHTTTQAPLPMWKVVIIYLKKTNFFFISDSEQNKQTCPCGTFEI